MLPGHRQPFGLPPRMVLGWAQDVAKALQR